MARVSLVGLAALLAFSVGCSGPDGDSDANSHPDAGGSSSTTGASAGTGAGGAASGASSAGTSGSGLGGSSAGGTGTAGAGGADAGAGGAGTENPKHGVITFFQEVAAQTSFVYAEFHDSPDDDGCSTVTAGPCQVATCAPSPPSDLPSAGIITFKSPALTGSAYAQPAANGSYRDGTMMSNLPLGFAGLEPGSFSAAGAEVPAFEVDVQLPQAPVLTAPAATKVVTNHVFATVDPNQDLQLKWSDGAAGDIIWLRGSAPRPDKQEGDVRVNCELPAAPGSGVIPSGALKALGPSVDMFLRVLRPTTVTAGAYSVRARAGLNIWDPTRTKVVLLSIP